MKKSILYCALIISLFSCFLLVGCNKNEITAEFVRFNIGQQQNNDYYLDFTIKFDNKTNQDITLLSNNFYIEINNEEKTDIVFLYEYEEVYSSRPTIKSKEKTNLRVRTISNMNNKDYNTIIVKFNNKEIVNDKIYITK